VSEALADAAHHGRRLTDDRARGGHQLPIAANQRLAGLGTSRLSANDQHATTDAAVPITDAAWLVTHRERTTLEQYARRPTTAQGLALRARIVLRCASGATHTAIAADLDVTIGTVGKWRRRFVANRLAGFAPRTASRQAPVS
jgi:hypothetical protein